MQFDSALLVMVAGVFALGGVVKGVVGFGLLALGATMFARAVAAPV